MSAAPAVSGEGSASVGPSSSPPTLHPAAPMHRRRTRTTQPQQQQQQQRTRTTTRGSQRAAPLPGYLAPTAATTARRREVSAEDNAAHTAAPRTSTSKAARDGALTSSLPATTATVDSSSFIEAVLDAQLHPTREALAPAADCAVPAALKEAPISTPAVVDMGGNEKNEHDSGRGVRTSPKPLSYLQRVGDEVADALALQEEMHTQFNALHTSLRLQPPPTPTAASERVEAALADVLGRTGDDGALTEALLEPRRTLRTSAQAALAAERAGLLHDSADSMQDEDVGGRRGKGIWSPTSATRRRSAATCAVVAAMTPAAVAEFLKTEAEAEAAAAEKVARENEQQQQQQQHANATQTKIPTAGAGAGNLPRQRHTLATSSAMAESTAVLRELEVMQQRLHQHGYRHHAAPSSPPQQQQQQQQQQQSIDVSQPKGYGSSPCDISGSSTASSTSSQPSSNAAGGTGGHRHKRSVLRDWAAASVGEVVDALDRASLESRAARIKKRKSRSPRRRHGKSRDFDPEVFVRSLLDGQSRDGDEAGDADPDALFLFSGESADPLLCARLLSPSSPPADPTDDMPRVSSLPNSMREAALRCGGPSWTATAAFDVGVTPSEVQELLRYSVSAPAAASWLSRETSRKQNCGPAEQLHAEAKSEKRGCDTMETREDGVVRAESRSEQRRRRSSSTPSYALDAATQTALVHRIISALPTVPPALTAEMARQRKLLERVCRDVAVAAMPVHEVLRERATSPTIASTLARQPPPIDLTTPADGAAGSRTRDAATAEREAYEALVAAALPRPAVKALTAVAGLRSAAADPSRPLPAYHTVVARPALGPSSPQQPALLPSSAPQPYEAALHDMAEREARHYVGELDRLRTHYDRQLATERQERRSEQRQYAALLHGQQERMLRHHRETVHLLQRESRLQQQQQEALVEQLAAKQSAAAQRQQTEQARVTRQMLSGAVEAMRSHCVSPLDMDTHAGLGRGGKSEKASRGAAAKMERVQRIHARTSAAAAPAPATAPAAKDVSDVVDKRATATTATAPSPLESQQQQQREVRRLRVQIQEPDEDAVKAEEEESFSRSPAAATAPFDADVPTLGHLTPLQQQLSAPVPPAEDAVPTLPKSSGAAEKDGSEVEVSPVRERRLVHHRRHAPQSSNAVTVTDAHTNIEKNTDARRSAPPPAAETPALQLNTSEALRSVYGGPRTGRDAQQTTTSPLQRSTSPPPPTRMTLPLHAHLPPEDELDRHLRRVAAATVVVDARAAAAAEAAGLASGTKLYAAVAAAPSQRKARVTAASSARTPTRLLSAPPAVRRAAAPSAAVAGRTSPAQQPRRSQTQPRRVGKGGSRQHPRRRPGARTAQSPGSKFDVEVVSLLSGLSGEDSQRGSDVHHVHNTWHQPHYHHSSAAPHGVSRAGMGIDRPMDKTHFTTAEEPQHPPPRLDAGLTAGRPSVGPTLLLLSDPPAMPAQHAAPPSTASATATARPEAAMLPPWLARASPAAALTQVVNADLQQAQHERERRVAELRDAAERQATHQRISAETVAGGDETALHVTDGPPQPVGALPPCDAAFFGAPDEIVQPSEDTGGLFNYAAAHTGSATDAVDSHRGQHSSPADFDRLLLAHPVAAHPRGTTDYARAWGRYEAAAAEVEAAAGALAAEDAGVLATVARVHHGREDSTPRQQQQQPLTHTAVPLPVPASAAAGVRYREQQLHALPGEKDAIEGGGAFVSPKMAEEARALTAARQRLAQIRDCFITPPTSLEAAAPAVAAMTPASVVGQHADAAVVRRMVDETVFSLLEEEGARQRDPVWRVVSAIEHELLRLLLQERLTETPSPAAAAASSTRHTAASLKELEPSLVIAMVEAALEDAVRATVSQRRAENEDGATAAAQQQPSKAERDRLALARALQQLADGGDTPTTSAIAHPLVDDVVREHVAVPVVPSKAWLHDTAEAGDAVPVANDAAAALTARTQTASPPPASTASTAPGNASVALVEATHAPSAGEAAAVRVVLDLSPAARQFFSRYDPTSAAARPPMQHEQLPSRWMAQEDRRDVIVEAELRPTRALLPPPPDVEVKEAAEVAAAPQHGTAEEGEERATQPVPPEKAAVDDMGAEVPVPTPPLPLLPPPPPPIPASGEVQSPIPAAMPVPTGLVVPTPWATTPAAVTNDFDAPLPVSAPLHAVQTASKSSAPPTVPPPPTLNYVPFMLSVLTTQLIDNEELQRGSLADREEEQRESLWRLRSVVHAKANRRGSRPATPPLRAPIATSTTGTEQSAAAPPSAALPSAPTLAPAQEHVQPATTTAAAPRLPPVRDPVMNAVLEYVYQFGGAQRSPTRAAPNLVEELQAAAAAAAAAAPRTPAAGESGGWLDGWEVGDASAPAVQLGADPASQRVARAAVGSQASTRNLGSSTSTASLPTEPSLPSSLRTDTSSSSLADTRWAAGVLPLAEAHHLHHRRTSAARPVVDVQRLDAAYRRGAMSAKKRAAAAGGSGSGGSDTTRYTTTDSVSDNPPQPPSRSEGANVEEKGAADALSSAVLPQRVSMEVQAALEAALRSHRLAAAEPTSTSPEGTMETSAAWPESSRYAVTLPAQSADTTREPDATLPAEKRTRPLRRRSPISPHPRKDVHRPREQKESDGGGVPVAALQAPPQRRHTAPPPASTQWEGYSLTSTSTSSHGGTVNAARQPSAALTSSALPFLS